MNHKEFRESEKHVSEKVKTGNRYGYFDEKEREFVITDPRTPRPWFNYMWNDTYTGLISHTGGGFSYYLSARDNRITRMRYNSLPWDRPGRYIYLKDTETGQFWSLSWAPTLNIAYDRYECRHGSGYTRIITEYAGIRAEIKYFVPTELAGEIWSVTCRDLSGKPRHLEIYAFTELLMGNALNDLINQPNDKHFTEISFDKKRQILISTRRYWVLNKGVTVKQPNIDWKYRVMFTSTLPVTGFDSSLDAFIGKWRSEADPQAVVNSNMQNTEICAGDPCAALQSVLELKAGAKKRFSVLLMLGDKRSETGTGKVISGRDIDELRSNSAADREFRVLREKWDRIYDTFKAETPDKTLDLMLNTWNFYQSHVTFDMARNAGYYHGGLLFGTGIRDQLQDIFSVLISDPGRVRERLLETLRFQYRDGSTLHNYFRLVGTGERTEHSDTPLWIPLAVSAYVKETADLSILRENAAFYDGGEDNVLTHMLLALEHALSETGPRGLPKIMNGDWNDTLDHVGPEGRGESIWGAFFLCFVLQEARELLMFAGEKDRSKHLSHIRKKLKERINAVAWDGEWYLRAFGDSGKKLGSAGDDQGRIFLNAQSWAVISDTANGMRALSAIEACLEQLETPYGMQICRPPYRRIDDSVGLISRCVPGKKENGSVFNHASAWFVLAAFRMGKIADACRIYRKMLPPVVSETAGIDRYETEPYVYSEYVTSPEHAREGQASHSWLTGSAVWMHYTGVSYMLGVRAEYQGLRIDPRIPGEWHGFRVKRQFRGKQVNIRVHNPRHLHSGVKEMRVNGKIIHGNILDVSQTEGHEIDVDITLENDV